MTDEIRRCIVCKVAVGVRRFTLAVDGEALQLEPDLCGDHGASFLFWVGGVVGQLVKNGRVNPRELTSRANAREALEECFAEYCDDMGEGYDAESFIDFCVVQLIDPPVPSRRKPDARGFIRCDGLPEWFREHAEALEKCTIDTTGKEAKPRKRN
ncbi:MAG TPA: hypothetical protein VF420_13285 [Casimicrobiaceae bacterium]